jgi:protein-tyrosine phosphatase
MGVTDLATYDSIIELIRAETDLGAVYVHCWAGVGRTGTVVGCLIAEDHTDHTAVLDHLARLRAGTRKASWACPQTDAQVAVLQHWLSRGT